jgi:hypothetical protein
MVNGMPGSCAIPAGKGVAVTVTFKSGDVVANPYQDSMKDYHHFYFLSAEALGAGQKMPYYYYTLNDWNMSNLMFHGDSAKYWPSILLEGLGTIYFAPEFHSIGVLTNCPNCPPPSQSVLGVTSLFESVAAFPNPADEEVNISFTVAQNEQVKISVVNALGQLIATQDVKAGKKNTVKFSTANMSAGMYFYTIEVNGQRKTDRFVVAH